MCSNMSGGGTEEEKFTQAELNKMSRKKLGSTTLQVTIQGARKLAASST